MYIRITAVFIFVFFSSYSSQTLANENHLQKMKHLQDFIFNDVARKAFSDKTPESKAANDFVESFPPYAKQEILEIMLLIMQEKGMKAGDDVNRMKKSGAQSAYTGFSPAVKAKVDALVNKLKNDKKFNNPENLKNMNQKMPAH